MNGFHCTEFWKRQNYGDNKKIHDLQELGRARDFEGSETTLCDTVMIDMCHAETEEVSLRAACHYQNQ